MDRLVIAYVISALITLLEQAFTGAFGDDGELALGRVIFWPIYWFSVVARAFWTLVTNL